MAQVMIPVARAPSLVSPVLHQLVEVLLHVLKDEVEVIVLSDHLLQFHHVGVVELLQ